MSWTLNPGTLAMQAAAGAINTPADVALGIPGALGNKRAAELHRNATEPVNTALGVNDPYWRDDPTAFIARQAGGAVVGLPAKWLSWGARAAANAPAAVRYAGRFLEAATPLTLPLNAKNIAINAAAGSVIGAGVQELAATEQAAQREASGIIPPEPDNSGIIPPEPEAVLPQEQQAVNGIVPPEPEEPAPIVPDAQEPRTLAGRAVQALPYVAIALGGGAGARAVMQARRSNAFNQAADAMNVVQPGRQVNPEVQQLSPADQAVQSIVTDAHAPRMALEQAVASGQLSPAQSLDVQGRIATQMAESAKGDIAREAMRTGELPDFPRRIRSRDAHEQEIAALKQSDRQAGALYDAALAAADELNTRSVNAVNGNWAPGTPGVAARVKLHNHSDADLENIVNTARADPRLYDLIEAQRQDMQTLLDFMVAKGLKSPEDAARMGAAHPNYLHTMHAQDRVERGHSDYTVLTTGNTPNSPLTARTYQHKGGDLHSQDPTISTNEAIRKVVSLALENDARRSFAQAMQPYIAHMKATAPNEPRLVRDVKVRVQDRTTPGWTTVSYLENGKRHAMEVAAPVAENLQSYPRATVAIMSGLARGMRNATTGPVAALFGSVQAPSSAMMAAMATTTNRPAGFKAGMIDSAVQKVTGGRLGVRADPTFVLNTASAAVRDLSSEAVRGFASHLRRAELNNSPLAKFIGPTRLRQWMNDAEAAYERSISAQMRRQGSAGTGISRDPDKARSLDVQDQALTPEYAAMAQRSDAHGAVNKAIETARHYGNVLTPVEAVRSWRMFNTVLDIISGSAASAFIRQNQGAPVSSKALHGMARRLAGDPAEHGSSPAIQKLTSVIPYSNITMQSTAAYVRAFRQHPVAATAGIATAIALPQMVQLASAIIADEWEMEQGMKPRHVEYILMQNASGQSGNITVHIPGTPPDKGMRTVIDPATAAGSAAVQNVMLRALYANTDRFWSDDNARLRQSFVELMDDRQSAGITAGMASMGLQVSPPPLLPAASYMLTGADTSKMFDFTNSRVSMPRDRGAPGFTDNKLFNDPVNHYVEAIGNAVGSVSFAAAAELYRTGVLAARTEPREGGPARQPLGAVADQYMLNTANSARILPPAMQHDRVHPQRDAVGNALQPIEAGLERIVNGWGDVTRPETVGSGRAVQAPLGVGRPRVNEEITPIIAAGHALHNATAKVRELRTAAQQQIISAQSSPEWRNDPIRLRQVINAETDKIRQYNALIYSIVTENEIALSQEYGRRVRFDDIDPQKGMEQFRRLR